MTGMAWGPLLECAWHPTGAGMLGLANNLNFQDVNNLLAIHSWGLRRI